MSRACGSHANRIFLLALKPVTNNYPVTVSDYGKLSLDAELEAVSIIGTYTGTRGKVIHKGKTDPYDFEIHYNDNRLAIGEVSILEDQNYRSWWHALLKQENNYSKSLPTGIGTWHASLKMSSRINEFHREIISYIEALEHEKIYELHIYEDWPLDELATRGRNLGISHINKIETFDSDILIYGSEGRGGSVPDTVEPLLVEIEKLLHGGTFQTSWTKLKPFDADEKHIFFKCGSLISDFLLEYLRPPHAKTLLADFNFPEGITHFWLNSYLQESATLLWISNGEKFRLNPQTPDSGPATSNFSDSPH